MEYEIKRMSTFPYLVLKEFHIHKKLPVSLFLPNEEWARSAEFINNLGSEKINVDDISKFKLLKNPERRWLEIIEKTRIEQDEINDEWEDYFEPLWYHEIRKNEDQFNRFGKTLPYLERMKN